MAVFKTTHMRTCKVFGLRAGEDLPTIGLVIGDHTTTFKGADEFYRELFSNLLSYSNVLYGLEFNLRVYMAEPDAIVTDIRRELAEINDLDGLVIAHKGLMGTTNTTVTPQLNYLRYIGYPITPDTKNNRKRDRLPSNPYACTVVYTVPSWLWASSNASKEEGDGLNLLGYVFLALRAAVTGEPEGGGIAHLLDKDQVDDEPFIVKSIEDFDDMMEELYAAPKLAIDTEGTSLNKLDNTLLTLQFCTGLKKKRGTPNLWVLPYAHPDTPFSIKELKYIRRTLAKFFQEHRSKQYHVYQNGKFDITMLASQLGVRWYASRVFDIMASTFTLDENTKFLGSKLGDYSAYGLDHIETRHGFTRPADLEVKKEMRGRMIEFNLDQIARYGAYDVLTIFALSTLHCKIAKERGYKGFAKIVTEQIGAMIVVTAFMEAHGVMIDKPYLQELASPFGKFQKEIDAVVQELYARPAVKEANKRLLRQRKNTNVKEALFADKADAMSFIFSISEVQSLQMLFFEVLGLEPVKLRKDNTGSVDKFFQKKYDKDYREVWLYSKYQRLLKLKSAFIDSILSALITNPDARMDGRIRPSFRFTPVVSGRSSCEDPNFQQIPTRSKEAKYIKNALIAAFGKILIKSDFSAHEIRVSGNITNDDVIIDTFKIANQALLDVRLAGSNFLEEAKAIAKRQGDIHILNVKVLFGLDIDKSHPLRSDVKQTIFSKVYGAMAPKIGRDMQAVDFDTQYDIIRDSTAMRNLISGNTHKLPETLSQNVIDFRDKLPLMNDEEKEQKYKELKVKVIEARKILETPTEDYIDKATDILEKLDDSWDDVAEVTRETQREGRENLVVFSPINRPRHLWAYAYPNKWVGLAMDRRGFNSEVQGLASDIAFESAYCIQKERYETFIRHKLKFDGALNLMVHDSMDHEVSLRMAPVQSYLVEHGMTTLVQDRMRDVFGMDVKVPYGFDIAFGKSEGSLQEWGDKRRESMETIIRDLAKARPDEYGDQLDDALHNLDKMWSVREKELRDDPYVMRLKGKTQWYAKNIRGLT